MKVHSSGFFDDDDSSEAPPILHSTGIADHCRVGDLCGDLGAARVTRANVPLDHRAMAALPVQSELRRQSS